MIRQELIDAVHCRNETRIKGLVPAASELDRFIAVRTVIGRGERRILEVLLASGVDVDVRDDAGTTPLMYACSQGQQDIVRMLLELGAGVNTVDMFGWSPLFHAVRERAVGVVRTLLESGADIGQTDHNGQSIWDIARQRPFRITLPWFKLTSEGVRRAPAHPEIARLLEEAGRR